MSSVGLAVTVFKTSLDAARSLRAVRSLRAGSVSCSEEKCFLAESHDS